MMIGVIGLIGSGKGTVSDILVGKGFVKESFAAPVKDAVADIFGWERALLEGDTSESREFREKKDEFWSKALGYDITPRLALQLMGTEAGRQVFGDDVWVHSLLNRASKNENTVIADVRFPNEIDSIRKSGGRLVQVSRGLLPEWWNIAVQDNRRWAHESSQMEEMYPNVHISEWAWAGNNNIQYTILNDGTIEDLREEVEKMLQSFA